MSLKVLTPTQKICFILKKAILHKAMDIIFAITLGLILGSFYACLIYRATTPHMTSGVRSSCPSCGKKLQPHHLIPVLSYLLLRGHCAYCSAPISRLYITIECISTLLSLFLVLKVGLGVVYIVYLLAFGLMLVGSVIDYYTYILPNAYTLGAFATIIPLGIILGVFDLRFSLYGALFAAGLSGILYLYFKYVRKKLALGLGDVKYLLFLGALVGILDVPLLFLISSFIGIIYIMLIRFCPNNIASKSRKDSVHEGYAKNMQHEYKDNICNNKDKSRNNSIDNSRKDSAVKSNKDASSCPENASSYLENETENHNNIWQTVIPFGPFLSIAATILIFWRL